MKLRFQLTGGNVGRGADATKTHAASGKGSCVVSDSGGEVGGIVKSKAEHISPAERLQDVSTSLEIAVRYAETQKPRLALANLREAERALALLDTKENSRAHPGLWKGGGVDALKATVAGIRAKVEAAAAAGYVDAPKESHKQPVVLFGSSCNPPTFLGGHAGIVKWAGTELLVDLPDDEQPELARERVRPEKVRVLPVYTHAFSEKRGMPSFEDRVEMAKRGLEHLPGLEGVVEVCETEKVVFEAAVERARREGRSEKDVRVGTIDVVRYLMEQEPDKQFILALGADTYRDLIEGKWKDGDKLLEMIPIVVVPREGVHGIEGTEGEVPDLTSISSTIVRGSTDLQFLRKVLHPKVLEYMIEHKLYGFAEGKEEA